MTVNQEIAAVVTERRSAGFDLGRATSGVVPADSGGSVQHFANGDVYWHASTGAHEVHGGILAEYLKVGGPGPSLMGPSELGYPTSHERPTPDGRFVRSRFQRGAIYWVAGAGAVVVSGPFWDTYGLLQNEDGVLGTPLESRVVTGDVEAVWFEFGCLAREVNTAPVSACWARELPRVGRPTIVGAGRATFRGLYEAHLDPGLAALGAPGGRRRLPRPRILAAFADRLALVPVGGGQQVDLDVSLRTEPKGEQFIDAQTRVSLSDRLLYDLAFKTTSGGAPVTVTPHSVYAKASWDRFGFVHVTDLHVARRQDRWHSYLRGRPGDAGAAFVNYNDGLREVIATCNSLHASGDLDIVVATGDLVDFVYESGDAPNGGGNHELLVDILRGRGTSPAAVPVEELRVPVFMIPGNHDYRPNEYLLRFDISVAFTSITHVDQYDDQNLTAAEADDVQGGSKSVSPATAGSMVKVVNPMWLLDRLIGIPPRGGYTVNLGAHRLVMIDTGADLGIPAGLWDAGRTYAGYGSEDEEAFQRHKSPNLEGISRGHLSRLERAITEAGATGVVIVGMHAPPLNPFEPEPAHYLRETEHPTADGREVEAFVKRSTNFGPAPIPAGYLPEWSRTGTAWFKRGTTLDLLDLGVARGFVDQFMELISGARRSRPADLVLAGHGHRRADYRAAWDLTANEMRYFTDFYFDQPPAYYRSVKVGYSDPVAIKVVPGAALNARPTQIRDHRAGTTVVEDVLEVPPCADTLPAAANKPAWWRSHRPFVCQTAASGPIEHSQRRRGGQRQPAPTFRGFRYGFVESGAVTDLRYVTLADTRAAGYRLARVASLPTSPPIRPSTTRP